MGKSNNVDSKPPNNYIVFVIIGCAIFGLYWIITHDVDLKEVVTFKPLKDYIEKRSNQKDELEDFKEVSLTHYSTVTRGMIDTSEHLTNFVSFTYNLMDSPDHVDPRFHSLPIITAIWTKDVSCILDNKEMDLSVGDKMTCSCLGTNITLYINYISFNSVWLTEEPVSDINFAYQSLPEIDNIVSYNGRPCVVYNDEKGENIHYTSGGQVRVENSIITIEDICEEVDKKKVFYGSLSFTDSDKVYSFFCYIIPEKQRSYLYEN